METKNYVQGNVSKIALAGLFLALTIILASFGVPVPGGKVYLCDVSVVCAALLLDPVTAMFVGGVGTFLGDILFYPPAMFVSLVVHGLQAYAISWISRNTFRQKPLYGAIFGAAAGVIIMCAGYTVGKALTYSTWEYAWISLPFEFLQSLIGAVGGVFLCYGMGLKSLLTSRIRSIHSR